MECDSPTLGTENNVSSMRKQRLFLSNKHLKKAFKTSLLVALLATVCMMVVFFPVKKFLLRGVDWIQVSGSACGLKPVRKLMLVGTRLLGPSVLHCDFLC